MTNNNRNNRLKEIEVEGSSGNVFADLGVANRLPTPPLELTEGVIYFDRAALIETFGPGRCGETVIAKTKEDDS